MELAYHGPEQLSNSKFNRHLFLLGWVVSWGMLQLRSLMKYRKLGNTGWKVSVLGYGASPLGDAFGGIDEKDGIRTVHAAIDLGVNFLDVSPDFGSAKAEIVLGKALREIPRERFYLATKVGRYGPEEKDFDFSAARVMRSVDESLRRLGVA